MGDMIFNELMYNDIDKLSQNQTENINCILDSLFYVKKIENLNVNNTNKMIQI